MRQRATKQQIALTIGLLTVLVAAGYWWAPHISWAFTVARNSANVQRIPISVLQAPGKTSGWFTCRLGALSFKLPPEMAEDAERSLAKEKNSIGLNTSSDELVIYVPMKISAEATPDLARVAAEMNLSLIQFIAEGYRASTDDFRWTMSRRELSRHKTLLSLGVFYPHNPGMKVETLFDGAVEGLLTISDSTHAIFEWQAKSGAAIGFIRFNSKSGNQNLDYVRDICASVTCDEAKLGPEPTKGELAELADSMEITKE